MASKQSGLWRLVFLLAALAFIATATLTPGSTSLSGALRPDFWCWACGSEGGADVTLNFALFIPFGMALALKGVSPFRALIAGMLVSMAVECAQHFGWPHDRVASSTDLVTNTAGAFAGALVAWNRAALLQPSVKAARVLLVITVLLVSGFLSFTAWALSPDISSVAFTRGQTGLQISQYPFTPGFGWYHGRLSEATINDAQFFHAGDGPIILRGAVPQILLGTISLSGRDERTEFVPFLYLHDIRVAQPNLMLGQEGTDARMLVTLRGHELRLPGPSAVLRNTFPEQSNHSQALSFAVTSKSWTLSSTSGTTTNTAVLPISLSLGWTLLQTVVHVGDRTGWLVSAVWLFVLWLPVGYWCVLAGRIGSLGSVIGGATALVLTLWLAPTMSAIASSSIFEWVSAIGGMVCGVFFATRYGRGQHGAMTGTATS